MNKAFRDIVIVGGLVLAVFAGGVAQAADSLTLNSPSLADGGQLAIRNASGNKANPNCVGENVSPALRWANPPAGTRSFAMLMFDTEGRGGLGVSHWVAYGIPATVTGFAEGEVSQPSANYIGGKSAQGLPNYIGPCPPPGGWHHYVFILIATDLEPGALAAGMTRQELLAALAGHSKGAAGLVGRFAHPN
jgi:Raf kinase inhibitor-like YbhB/YbcL family protein